MLAIGEISGIDPHLVDVLECADRRIRREVNISHEGDVHPATLELRANLAQGLDVSERRSRDAHELAARVGQAFDLSCRAPYVAGICRRHRL